jgi:hypothetical protein
LGGEKKSCKVREGGREGERKEHRLPWSTLFGILNIKQFTLGVGQRIWRNVLYSQTGQVSIELFSFSTCGREPEERGLLCVFSQLRRSLCQEQRSSSRFLSPQVLSSMAAKPKLSAHQHNHFCALQCDPGPGALLTLHHAWQVSFYSNAEREPEYSSSNYTYWFSMPC